MKLANGFAPPVVPLGTEPDLQALNNPFIATAKAAKEQHVASHNSHLIAADTFKHHLPAAPTNDHLSQQVLSWPVIANLLDDNLDPTLWSINQGDFGLQDTDTKGSDASKEGSDIQTNKLVGENLEDAIMHILHSWDEDDQAAGTLASDDALGSDNSEMGASQKKATKASKDPGDGPKSTQLAWYGPHWKHFLGEAKGKCHVLHTLENAFPKLVPDLSTTITESFSASLVQWMREGNQVEADVWLARKPDMARLLYDDLSTWQSDLKKIVVTITPVYALILPTDLSTQEHANWVEAAAADLLDKSKYLRDGKDELRKTKNFAHPGLCKATILFLYFNCVFDGLKKNRNGKTYSNFLLKDYLCIYNRMLRLLKDIMNNPCHGLKLMQWLHKWVEAGWYGYEALHSI
ncbi:hypothetical protein BDR06DRAFT_970599 [Suillus hirtellus]|nr:hypothetical protein BDR06DRAFT_970599 [Suillus hirtellus]